MPSEPEALAHLRPVSSRHTELPVYRLGDADGRHIRRRERYECELANRGYGHVFCHGLSCSWQSERVAARLVFVLKKMTEICVTNTGSNTPTLS